MGTTMECWSARPSLDEEILMNGPDRSEAFSPPPPPPKRKPRRPLSLSAAIAAFKTSLRPSLTVRSTGAEISRWMLSPADVASPSDGSPPLFRGRRCWLYPVAGAPPGAAYEIQLRPDLLEIMSSGHINVLRVHGLLLHDTLGLCQVAEYKPGGSLEGLIRRTRGGLPGAAVRRLAADIAAGLKFFNDRGAAYRDLNARRVLLDGGGGACLGAVAAAAAVTGAAAAEYETAGYRWRAPEVIGGDPETAAETWMSNVYSFGMVVWEMVAGEAAYGGCSPVQAALGVAAGGLRPEIPAGCPPPLAALMRSCWHADPRRRPTFSHILSVLSAASVNVNVSVNANANVNVVHPC
ncbi:uncharacterized protein LOC144715461 [Wolffia australiana]